jgi:hypothetical protein
MGSLVLLIGEAQAQRRADDAPAPQPTSRGENFSARPPAQVFQSDCTGSGCHSSPRGLIRGYSVGGLVGFLREHYTNSRESAAALAGYLISVGAATPERAARPQSPVAPARPPRAVGREEPSDPQAGARPGGRQRGRQVATPVPEAAPPLPPEPPPAPAPAATVPPPKPKPKPQQFDIFD